LKGWNLVTAATFWSGNLQRMIFPLKSKQLGLHHWNLICIFNNWCWMWSTVAAAMMRILLARYYHCFCLGQGHVSSFPSPLPSSKQLGILACFPLSSPDKKSTALSTACTCSIMQPFVLSIEFIIIVCQWLTFMLYVLINDALSYIDHHPFIYYSCVS